MNINTLYKLVKEVLIPEVSSEHLHATLPVWRAVADVPFMDLH